LIDQKYHRITPVTEGRWPALLDHDPVLARFALDLESLFADHNPRMGATDEQN
jgi:hypothetical protein